VAGDQVSVRGNRPQILVVDDSATARQLVVRFLRENGCWVLEAQDGEQGLLTARSQTLALIITDVNMPKKDGIEMIREIRTIPAHLTTPILILTTGWGAYEHNEGKAAGANAWMMKPFRRDLMSKALQKFGVIPTR